MCYFIECKLHQNASQQTIIYLTVILGHCFLK